MTKIKKPFYRCALALCVGMTFFLSLALFCGCDSGSIPGSLFDISHPYTGVYRCEYVKLGDENLLDQFDYITLELKGDGLYKLSFRQKDGVKGAYRGHYHLDTENNLFTIHEKIFGKHIEKSFRIENGAIDITVLYGDREFAVRFVMS